MLYASIHSEVNLSVRQMLSKRRWARRPGACPRAGYSHSNREGCSSFRGTRQSTGHQQGSLKVQTFRLPFWPPCPLWWLCPPCKSLLQLTVSSLVSPSLYALWMQEMNPFFLFSFKSSPMLEALWFSDYTLNWESEFLSLSFSFCISPVRNVGDTRDEGSIPGLGRSPGEGNGNPIQYSFL